VYKTNESTIIPQKTLAHKDTTEQSFDEQDKDEIDFELSQDDEKSEDSNEDFTRSNQINIMDTEEQEDLIKDEL